MSAIPREWLRLASGDLEEALIPRLLGTVFHVTRLTNVPRIERSGAIQHNRDGRFRFTMPQSINSYGRSKGYICLFDFRDKTADDARGINLDFFHFTDPFQPLMYDYKPFPKRVASGSTTYYFLKDEAYANLLDASVVEAEVRTRVHIREAEVWYPTDLPLSLVARTLSVRIDRRAEHQRWNQFVQDTLERIGAVFFDAQVLADTELGDRMTREKSAPAAFGKLQHAAEEGAIARAGSPRPTAGTRTR